MPDTILLNKKLYTFTESDLPCLVTYAEKTGGSHFSITMIADLFRRGSKILFLTAYPMAKDNFLAQVGDDHSNIAYITSVEELEDAKEKQVIILESGNESLFIEIARMLPDITERVVLIKNMEVFSEAVFDICMPIKKIVLSGNIDTCVAKNQISTKEFATIIAFTKPEISLPIDIPSLEKYTGYLSSIDQNGIVEIRKDSI